MTRGYSISRVLRVRVLISKGGNGHGSYREKIVRDRADAMAFVRMTKAGKNAAERLAGRNNRH